MNDIISPFLLIYSGARPEPKNSRRIRPPNGGDLGRGISYGIRAEAVMRASGLAQLSNER
jgi:hypothetical protein